MDSIGTLIDDVASIEWSIPVSIKLTLVLGFMIFLSVSYYMFKDNDIIAGWGNATLWLYILIMINLANIAGVMIYNAIKTVPHGRPGIRGKSGKKGKSGKYLTCSYCKTNLYIDTVRKYDTIVHLNIYNNPITTKMLNDVKYYNNLFANTDSIDITALINSTMDLSMKVVAINHLSSVVGKADGNNMGQINRPYGKVGFLPLGDGITGASEEGIELNYFMIKGDIVYPAQFTKLVQFPVNVNDEGLTETVSLWHPEPITISESGKPIKYYPLGDISNYSSDVAPTLNSIGLVSENCLQPIEDDRMELMFLYSGIAQITNKTKTFVSPGEDGDDGGADSSSDGMFKITSNVVQTDTMFSVWRTPFNTLITNIPSEIVNNTFAYNALNGREVFLDENGFLKLEAKKYITNRLSSIPTSPLMTYLFYVENFKMQYQTELDYYINKNLNANPTLKSGYKNGMSLPDLMTLVKNAKSVVDNYVGGGKSKPPVEVPVEVMRTYSNINKEIGFLPFKIMDAKTMLDMVDDMYPGGIETMIAVDDEGDAEGGIRLTLAQTEFMKVCKLLFLPDVPIMEIKDECIGTYQRDKAKDDAIRRLDDILVAYKREMDKYKTEPEMACANWEAVQNYSMGIFRRIGEYVGHIPDYQRKIEKMDLNEFTTSKIVKIADLYQNLVDYITGACKKLE